MIPTGAIAPNYHPLPVDIVEGTGSWVTDADGVSYLDFLSAYSALNFGHRHPALVAAARDQLDRLTLTSRAFGTPTLTRFCTRLAAFTGTEMVAPMNTGAEAVETAIKAARRWGYERRGVPADQAEIVVCDGNFHGRTTTIVSFSDDQLARDGFGPFTPGFVSVPHGDAPALRDAIDDHTVAFLVEPIQGENGVRIPPPGYLREVRSICDDAGILLVADEIQSGLGRTGATFACDLEDVRPDLLLLGKALGGGIVPISAVAGSADVLGVLTAGRHGSTFGGNPLACAIALAVLDLLEPGTIQQRTRDLGAVLTECLAGIGDVATEIRAIGLWAGIDIDPAVGTGREVAERALRRGVLVKDTHTRTIRIAPPLTITEDDLRFGCGRLRAAVANGD